MEAMAVLDEQDSSRQSDTSKKEYRRSLSLASSAAAHNVDPGAVAIHMAGHHAGDPHRRGSHGIVRMQPPSSALSGMHSPGHGDPATPTHRTVRSGSHSNASGGPSMLLPAAAAATRTKRSYSTSTRPGEMVRFAGDSSRATAERTSGGQRMQGRDSFAAHRESVGSLTDPRKSLQVFRRKSQLKEGMRLGGGEEAHTSQRPSFNGSTRRHTLTTALDVSKWDGDDGDFPLHVDGGADLPPVTVASCRGARALGRLVHESLVWRGVVGILALVAMFLRPALLAADRDVTPVDAVYAVAAALFLLDGVIALLSQRRLRVFMFLICDAVPAACCILCMDAVSRHITHPSDAAVILGGQDDHVHGFLVNVADPASDAEAYDRRIAFILTSCGVCITAKVVPLLLRPLPRGGCFGADEDDDDDDEPSANGVAEQMTAAGQFGTAFVASAPLEAARLRNEVQRSLQSGAGSTKRRWWHVSRRRSGRAGMALRMATDVMVAMAFALVVLAMVLPQVAFRTADASGAAAVAMAWPLLAVDSAAFGGVAARVAASMGEDKGATSQAVAFAEVRGGVVTAVTFRQAPQWPGARVVWHSRGPPAAVFDVGAAVGDDKLEDVVLIAETSDAVQRAAALTLVVNAVTAVVFVVLAVVLRGLFLEELRMLLSPVLGLAKSLALAGGLQGEEGELTDKRGGCFGSKQPAIEEAIIRIRRLTEHVLALTSADETADTIFSEGSQWVTAMGGVSTVRSSHLSHGSSSNIAGSGHKRSMPSEGSASAAVSALRMPSWRPADRDASSPTSRESLVDKMRRITGLEPLDVTALGTAAWDASRYTREELAWYVMAIFEAVGLLSSGLIPHEKLWRLVQELLRRYQDVPYHGCQHAVDVTHSVAMYILRTEAQLALTEVEVAALMLAALAHDVGHPGVNNAFLAATRDPIALRYNDQSILENMHAATLFEVMQDTDLDVFGNFSRDQWDEARSLICASIMHTDMKHHFAMTAQLEQIAAENDISPLEPTTAFPAADRAAILRAILHLADLSNPLKPAELAEKWAQRVTQEFWRQGDREKEMGLQVAAMMDRDKTVLSQTQISFIDFIVTPFFLAIVSLLPDLDLEAVNLLQNRVAWQKRYAEHLEKDASRHKSERAQELVQCEQRLLRLRQAVGALQEAHRARRTFSANLDAGGSGPAGSGKARVGRFSSHQAFYRRKASSLFHHMMQRNSMKAQTPPPTPTPGVTVAGSARLSIGQYRRGSAQGLQAVGSRQGLVTVTEEEPEPSGPGATPVPARRDRKNSPGV
ncbi:unnamed protein product [Pedinophyceae sp. YPF-701]|nr:unnamed protein product [Pedinophyceae sp. YPF-701]